MANDFKRMWTREEVKSNSVVDLPDIPDVVDANSPDIIRVQGKLYYREAKEGVTNLTGTKWYFNETINYNDTLDKYINFKSNNKSFVNIYYNDIGELSYYETEDSDGQIVNDPIEWSDQAYRNIEITGGHDVTNAKLITFLQENATLLPKQYTYVEIGVDEEVVKSIPTEVSIIEDQGKLELMLEHDGNVLAVNDTPNQFLQRRLDKPSADAGKFVDITNFIENIKKGDIIYLFKALDVGAFLFYGVVRYNNEDGMGVLPITTLLLPNENLQYYIIDSVYFNKTTKLIEASGRKISDGTYGEITIGFNVENMCVY